MSSSPSAVLQQMSGTGLLVRYQVYRDRLLIGPWLFVLTVLCFASAASVDTIYPTEADQVAAAEALNASPAVVALYGPILDVHSYGELAMTKLTVLYAVFVAVMAMFLVRRHARSEEDTGQTELISGTAVGRNTVLTAAVSEGALVVGVLGVLVAIANAVGGLSLSGSIAFGASWVGVGLVSVGLTALACQLSANPRTCAALVAGALALLFGLRAVGDTTTAGWLSWLSPFGWSTQVRAYSEIRWWVLLLYVALATVLVVVAQVLRDHRDLGSGLVAERPGPTTASGSLSTAAALTAWTHRPMLVAWTISMLAGGMMMGVLAPGISALLESDSAREMIASLGGVGRLEETMIAAEMSMAAVIVSCFAITVVVRQAIDEREGLTEQLLATAATRSAAFGATAGLALFGSLWLLAVASVGALLGYAGAGGELGTHGVSPMPLLGSGPVHAPAVWVVTGLALLTMSVRRSWAGWAWGLPMLFVALGQIAELLRLPNWVADLSPYTQSPLMPADPLVWRPLVLLTAVAGTLTLLAWARYRQRDIG